MKIVLNESGHRLDTLLTEESGLSRSYIKKLFGEGRVLLDGKAAKPGVRPAPGGVAEINLPDLKPDLIEPENIPLDIRYEDEHILVVNKPRGMVVHPAPGHFSGTLVNALLHHCGGTLSGINGVLRPGIVHRLDMDTSGLLVAAKNDAAHKNLSLQFQARTAERRYEAICLGRLSDSVTVDKPIARHSINRKKMAVDAGGRQAITHFTPIKIFKNHTHLEAKLETGRTHQVRVHLAHIGRPVLGDTIYGGGTGKHSKHFLHAKILGFRHPITGESTHFEADLPDYFAGALSGLQSSASGT